MASELPASGLPYRPLDPSRNELRVLRLHPPASSSDPTQPARDILTCSMEYVSLDDLSSEYSDFLRIDGRDQPDEIRATLWDCITATDEEKDAIRYMLQSPGLSQSINQANTPQALMKGFFDKLDGGDPARAVYRDRARFSRSATRWSWGDLVALSYAWGDPGVTSPVVVDGVELRVTKSLESALRSFRDRWEASYPSIAVWADALCINQRDVQERNVQVKRMKDIYCQSSSVFIHVGDGIERGEQFAERVAKLTVEGLDSPTNIDQATLELLSGDELGDWLELVSRPYWSRLWVIQEMLLANTSSKLWFGRNACLLSVFLNASRLMLRVLPLHFSQGMSPEAIARLMHAGTRMELLIQLHQFKYGAVSDKRPDLLLLLRASRSSQQYDPRDKIYALLGLLDPDIVSLVHPDYNAPLLGVYTDFVEAVVKATHKLDIIWEGSASSWRNDDFPSWIPDWTEESLYDIIYYDPRLGFCASGSHLHSFVEGGSAGQLQCRGHRVGLVGQAGGVPTVDMDEIPPEEHNWKSAQREDENSPSPYGDHQAVAGAVWEALFLGRLGAPSSIVNWISNLPWFNGAAMSRTVRNFWLIDQFQQVNKELTLAGKPFQSYFPQYSDAYAEPPEDLAVVETLNVTMASLLFRRFLVTNNGYLGLGPKTLTVGDEVWVLAGCSLLVVLRPKGGGQYKLMGECYVSGAMKGELVAGIDEGRESWEAICLV